jgi:hypothetical protein
LVDFSKLIFSVHHDECHKIIRLLYLILCHQLIETTLMKNFVLGNDALSQGTISPGLSGFYACSGTPSIEINTYLQKSKTTQELEILYFVRK